MPETAKPVMEIVQPIVDAAYQSDSVDVTESFDEDVLKITLPRSFVTSELDIPLDEFRGLDCVSISPDTESYTITYQLWMTFRRPTQDEVDAAISGVEDAQANKDPQDEGLDFSDTETVYYRKGYEEGVPGNEDRPAEEALAGKLPKVIAYHRDKGYSGPKHMGRAVDFNGITEYEPRSTAEMIENGDPIASRSHEYPEFECHTPDGKTYTFAYWIDE